MNTRTAVTLIVAILLVHLSTVALFVYALTHAAPAVSFPLAPRPAASAVSPSSHLPVFSSSVPFHAAAANGALSAHPCAFLSPVVPARGSFLVGIRTVCKHQPAGSRAHRAPGFFPPVGSLTGESNTAAAPTATHAAGGLSGAARTPTLSS
jgi:hypothetical protein